MSELTRRLIHAFPGRGSQPGTEVAPPPRVETPVALEVTVPDGLSPSVETDVPAAIGALLSDIARRLRLTGRFELAVTHAPSPEADWGTLSIDGRPAAMFGCPRSADLDDVACIAGEAVTRSTGRLSLLAGGDTSGPAALASYLTELGLPRPDLGADVPFDVESAEALVNQAPACSLDVEVSEATLRRVPDGGAEAMTVLRRRELLSHGVVFPDVHLLPTAEPPGTVRLRLNAVRLPAVCLGQQAAWPEVVSYLGDELRQRRHWFLRVSDVEERVAGDLMYFFPDLVAVTRDNYSLEALTACLRELVRAGGPIRFLPRIFWLLLEQGTSHAGPDAVRLAESPLLPKARSRPRAERDPVVLAARVRKLAYEEAWRLGDFSEPAPAVRLPEELERMLLEASAGPELGAAEWGVVRTVAQAPDAEVVVTRHIEAIAAVRGALQALPHPPRVMASHELPPDADLASMRILGSRTAVLSR